MNKHATEILYSEEDEGYIAVVPELPGCSAFGQSEEEALQEIKTAVQLWLQTAKKDGREIPKPCGKEVLQRALSSQSQQPRP
jgi:predicted RNase H-like HicB family nuclease